MNYFANSVTA